MFFSILKGTNFLFLAGGGRGAPDAQAWRGARMCRNGEKRWFVGKLMQIQEGGKYLTVYPPFHSGFRIRNFFPYTEPAGHPEFSTDVCLFRAHFPRPRPQHVFVCSTFGPRATLASVPRSPKPGEEGSGANYTPSARLVGKGSNYTYIHRSLYMFFIH